MSGWTILTVRARPCKDYDRAKYNDYDPWSATADICASFKDDERVLDWTAWNRHVYALLNCPGHNATFAETLIDDYSEMIDDFAVLNVNDTTYTGTARYYPSAADPHQYVDEYKETQEEGGYCVGQIAMATITARHKIVARDPFSWSSKVGIRDDRYAEDGTSFAEHSDGVTNDDR